MTNIALASHILGWLKARGVRDICLCPGGRNAPFVEILSPSPDFQIHSSFDERSAGFFALGLTQRNKSPAAIITTSGTAVAEVLPSVMEAHYAGLPLIVISADRPRRLRGTGAPQAVEQVGMFGVYAEQSLDLQKEFRTPEWSGARPLHINVCFDEPLLDD
jgi:2-succinyl-5-enolpyruvyl-6-hydroxy-3-cyclohexene-1-carboxylate synthase